MTKHIVVVGSINLDLVVSAARHPSIGETLQGTGFEVFTGGKGANQAVAAARLGHQVYMIGKIGSDAFAAQLLEELETAGVGTHAIEKIAGPSGVALVITLESGQNSIIIIPGANNGLSPQDIQKNQALIQSAGVVLTQLETPLEATEALAELTSSHGVQLILDPAPARDLPAGLLRKVTWITPNETEAQRLAGSTSSPSSEIELRELAEHFMSLGPQNVLLKLGDRGVYLATRDGLRASVPAYQVQAVDTTAAGDAFNGAFAVALARGSLPADAVFFASAVAAIAVTRRGAFPSMPTQADVDAFLAEQTAAQSTETQSKGGRRLVP